MSLMSGERLIRCLTGEPVDRVPFGVFGVCWSPWGSTMERWKRESGDPKLDYWRAIGAEEGCGVLPLHYGILPHFPREVVAEDAETVTVRTEFGVVKRDLKTGTGAMAEWVDYPVHSPEEWQRLKAERLIIEREDRFEKVDWAAWRAMDTEGRAIQVGTFPFGVFGTVRDFVGVETMLYWMYDHPAVIHDMMDHLTSLWLWLYERVAREVQIDHIHIWEDMSGRQGSLISPAMVETFMMPCYDRIAAFARSHGVRVVSVDTDGLCDELVPLMMRHGINMFFPFEVQAGNDIREYRKRYPQLGIVGGLDKNALALGRKAIDVEVAKARWMLENGGRYIPGFDHLIPPNVPWENMLYAARALRALCMGY
jgi:uroporphyrinogen decarboxylase